MSDPAQKDTGDTDVSISTTMTQENETLKIALSTTRKLLAAYQRGEVPPADPKMPYYVDQAWLDSAPEFNGPGAVPLARSGHTEVDKMLETNQLDELGSEVARLQAALLFWLPSITDREDEVAIKILEDAFLLVGIDGNFPSDFKTAQELGWISITASAQQQAGALTDPRVPAQDMSQPCSQDEWKAGRSAAKTCKRCEFGACSGKANGGAQ